MVYGCWQCMLCWEVCYVEEGRRRTGEGKAKEVTRPSNLKREPNTVDVGNNRMDALLIVAHFNTVETSVYIMECYH